MEGGGAASMQRGPGGGPGEGGGTIIVMDSSASRFRLNLCAQVSSLFTTTNLNTFVGNQLSRYFGQATSAAPPRRIEIGASISF